MTTRNALSLELIEAGTVRDIKMGATFGPFSRFCRVAPNGTYLYAAGDAHLSDPSEPVCFGMNAAELVDHCNMRMAFDAVQNMDDWKQPVDALVLTAHTDIIGRAIEHFTATKAEFTPVGDGKTFMHVKAAGYWAGPAA